MHVCSYTCPWTLIPTPVSQVLESQDSEGTQIIFNFLMPHVSGYTLLFCLITWVLWLFLNNEILLFILWNLHTYITSIVIISAQLLLSSSAILLGPFQLHILLLESSLIVSQSKYCWAYGHSYGLIHCGLVWVWAQLLGYRYVYGYGLLCWGHGYVYVYGLIRWGIGVGMNSSTGAWATY